MSAQTTVTVELSADGRGWVNGNEVKVRRGQRTLESARAAALDAVTRIAKKRRRAVLVAATEPDGHRWQFGVRPDGHVVESVRARELMTDPDADETPEAYRAAVGEICAVLNDERAQPSAIHLAVRLEEAAADEHGAEHPYFWRVRELRAHAMTVCGLPGGGCELYIEAAYGWRLLNSDEAYIGAAQRAYALWHQATEEPARMVWLGERLAELLRSGGGRTEGALTKVLERVDEIRSAVAA